MELDENKIREIWSQDTIPVIFRPKKGKLRVKLPKKFRGEGFRVWPRISEPIWNNGHYIAAASWFNDLTKNCLEKYHTLYIIQPYNEMEKCSSSCKNAKHFICECSCLGEYHGQGNSDNSWFEVAEALQVRWKGEILAARLITNLI